MECNKKYDWLIVGSGLYGAVFAHYAIQAGKSALVIDRRDKVGGNIRCEQFNGVTVHSYGAHIFHTNNKGVWDFVNERIPLTYVSHSPVAITETGKALPLPFNMYTFAALWDDVSTPEQARAKIAEQTKGWEGKTPQNLEEKALSMVGEDIYHALIKGYTEKQWGRACTELPPQIIERLPLRFTYDNCYFNDRYVGVPENGYNPLIESLLEGADVKTGVDYLKSRDDFAGAFENLMYTGCIDEFFGFPLGRLDYRSLRFDTKILGLEQSQGCPVVNYTGRDVPYTRIIEHNAFAPKKYYEETVISREYPADYSEGGEPYYPVIDTQNKTLYAAYRELAKSYPQVHFGGRLGLFEYMDMDDAILSARSAAADLI